MSTLVNLKLQAEKLITDLEVYLSEAEQIEVNKGLLDDRERTNKTWEDNLQEVDTKLNNKEKDFKSQENYLDTIRKQYEGWESKLKFRENKIKEDLQKIEDIEQKQKELDIKEKQIDLKLGALTSLQNKEVEIDRDQILIAKEKAVDRKRKEILEIREKKIKDREAQLQMESEIGEL